ncbi:ABC-three component system middle component 6 [Larkinella soli]|uniref:ABC-three component system middle component 6 n=1 Tax=Larkinella soli TaxID=1770527 RepID=UPI0035B6923F
MILPIDIKPEKSLYVIGSKILETLNSESMGIIDIQILYEKLAKNFPEKISFSYFLYALDWLFILGLISINSKSGIERCY